MLIGAQTKKKESSDKTREFVKEQEWTAFQTMWGSPASLKLPASIEAFGKSSYKHGEDPVWVLQFPFILREKPILASLVAN